MEAFKATVRRKVPTRRSPSTAAVVPRALRKVSWISKAYAYIAAHLNWYRAHLLVFSLLPLFASLVFFGSNGRTTVSFTDSLFMCYSAMTMTGLNSVLLDTVTMWQQLLLFFLVCIGSTPSVSIVTIIVRRSFFRRKFEHLVANSARARQRVNAIAQDSENVVREDDDFVVQGDVEKTVSASPVQPTEPPSRPVIAEVFSDEPDALSMHSGFDAPPSPTLQHRRRVQSAPRTRVQQLATSPPVAAPRSPAASEFPLQSGALHRDDPSLRHRTSKLSDIDVESIGKPVDFHPLQRVPARLPARSSHFKPDSALTTGYGGFPNPITIAASAVGRRIAASGSQRQKSAEVPVPPESAKPVPYFSFTPSVGRNSKFKGLTDAQQEELGGVEFRALSALLRIVVAYSLLVPLGSVLLLAPWLSTSARWKPVFEAPDTTVSPVWFTAFTVWSAFGNSGLSLHDSSLIPFQQAYWFLIVIGFLIIAGNTGFPILLRVLIWVLSKAVPKQSRLRETLQFLLDHPRRCFLYLFPAHQTWYLVFVLLVLNCIDWASFLILDIGNEEIEAIPIGNRVFLGLFQAVAVRSAGFAIVSLATIAPALQVLYVSMFQVATYPIAVAIRSTNVYEEKSLGIFDEEDDEDEVEAKFATSAKTKQPRTTSSYISYHARKQLAFDMWWLVLALWFLCIIERSKILDGENPWITIFSLLFELSSAYGNIGLSLGNGINNASLSAVLRPGSRLILIAVMIRGRHRGLPRAIDRSIMLPDDLIDQQDDTSQTARSRRGSADATAARRSDSVRTAIAERA